MSGGPRTTGQHRVARAIMRLLFKTQPSGFTVIEVMIVLAITGLLFVSAAALISGKQNQTAFDQAIRQVQSQMQQVINDVSVGYYPNLGDIKCNGAGGTVALTKASGTQQGANAGCIFMGKAVQFKMSGTDPEQFNVYSLAGLQKNASGNEATSLAEAKPKVIAPTPTAGINLPDSTATDNLQSGLTTARMWYNNGAGDKSIGIVAFTNSLASYDATTGNIMSGSQQVDVVPIDDGNIKSKLDQDKNGGVDIINSKISTATINPANGVFICFASGGTKQSGLITIGSNGRQLSVNLTIKSGTVC
jgi:prepilin-type N-terminal cleavage/methylation domain-containing protein